MTTSNLSTFELVSALRQQLDAGINLAIEDIPGQFADFRWPSQAALQAQKAPPETQFQTQQNKPALPVSQDVEDIQSAASARPITAFAPSKLHPDFGAISSLSELRVALEKFEGCALKKTASNLVFADGHEDADIMIIGEAPGRDEDRMGLPFVGAAGQLLDKMLRAIGLGRTDVYITNILPWRPPGNRTPSVEEVEMLTPFLMHHIKLKHPKIILALGGSSAKLLLNSTQGIMKLRGKEAVLQLAPELHVPVLPSLHPAYLLRAPAMKRLAFQDLLYLKKLSNSVS